MIDYIITSNVLNFVSLLCIFAGTLALSIGTISLVIAKEYLHRKNPRFLSKLTGKLVGIKNKNDAIRYFEGGSFEEMKKNIDSNAPLRGIIYVLVGTGIGIISIIF